MKKKKNYIRIMVIIAVILVIGLYFCYKGYNYLICRSDTYSDISYDDYMDRIKVHEDMVVKSKKIDDNDYLVLRNIKIKNDFKDYNITYCSKDSCIYSLKDGDKTIALFSIGINDTMINKIMEELVLTKKDKEAFLKDNNITNDIELLDYLLDNHNVNSNIFTSVKRMKSNYLTDHYTRINLGNATYITKIKGDYDGYIMGEQKVESVNSSFKNANAVLIFNDNKNYLFNFWIDDKFNEDYMKNIIETVVIEESDINTFIRTYKVIDIKKIKDSNKTILKLSQFQGEEGIEVEVFNSYLQDIKLEKDKYYEFTFQKRENSLNDDILSIFNGSNLLGIKKTDKEGLEQRQEAFN